MIKTNSIDIDIEKEVRVPEKEYLRLKRLENKFQLFWGYLEHLVDIREARKQIKQGEVIEQEKLFKELGLDLE